MNNEVCVLIKKDDSCFDSVIPITQAFAINFYWLKIRG